MGCKLSRVLDTQSWNFTCAIKLENYVLFPTASVLPTNKKVDFKLSQAEGHSIRKSICVTEAKINLLSIFCGIPDVFFNPGKVVIAEQPRLPSSELHES